MQLPVPVQSIDNLGNYRRTTLPEETDVRPAQRLATDPEWRSGAVCDRAAVAGCQPVGGGAGRPRRHAAGRAAGADALSRAIRAGGAAQCDDGAAAGRGWTG